MNLINDPWIPVRRKDGTKEKIAPWQLTDKYMDNPIVELVAVRPDFNGALIQFLIGLLQTTCAPQSNKEWRQWLNNPPLPDQFKAKFEPISFAFNLDGNGPRFMQDLTIEEEKKKTTEDIEKLLIDAPGEQTLKQNKDLFIKRRRIKRVCLSCCAQALLTLQINAPSGGKGHRVGLRGGGPISTIVIGESLWQTVWQNVLLHSEFCDLAILAGVRGEDKFPWLAEARTSEENKSTTNQDVHPAQIYWSMPRRIRLLFDDKNENCDICHEQSTLIVKEYLTKPYGIKYEGIIHPLTPTYKNKDGLVLSVHQHGALGYKYWLGYVCGGDGANPAGCIRAAFSRRLSEFRIWTFGYDMDNMKACCWYEGIMPVALIDDEKQWKAYVAYVAMLINAANEVNSYLSKAVAKAISAGILNAVRQRFWQETEADFYRQIATLRDDAMQGGDGVGVRRAWHDYIKKKAEDIFNDMSQAEMIEFVDARRVAKAHNELCKNLNGKQLKTEILAL